MNILAIVTAVLGSLLLFRGVTAIVACWWRGDEPIGILIDLAFCWLGIIALSAAYVQCLVTSEVPV